MKTRLSFPCIKIIICGTLLCLFGGVPSILLGQTPKENLEQAVEGYNAFRAYEGTLDRKKVTSEQIEIAKNRVEKGVVLLNKVIAIGNTQEVKAAQYFKNNYNYLLGFLHGAKGENALAYDIFRNIERDMLGYQKESFPIKYQYFDKPYAVSWDNFATTQAEYITAYAEVCYNLSKFEDASRLAKLAVSHPSTTDWLSYVSVNKLLDIYKKQNSILNDDEYYDWNLVSMQQYTKLKDTEKQTVKENKYATWERGYKVLSTKLALNNDNNEKAYRRYGEAANLLVEINENEKAIPFYQRAISKGWGQKSDLEKALKVAKQMKNSSLGQTALDRLATQINTTDCESYRQISDDYTLFGFTNQATTMMNKANQCFTDRKIQAEKAEAERIKQEKARKKAAYRSEHPFNIFISADIVPLLTKVEKMDYLGYIDFRGRKFAHSFGYGIVRKKVDFNSRSYAWDGFRASYAFKVFGKNSGDVSYSGLYFGYADKTFEPLQTFVEAKSGGVSPMNKMLTPRDKQYEVMLNSGAQVLGKGLGFDMYFGIGASYNILSYKEINIKDYDLTGNRFVENRIKEKSFNLKMRLGFTIGLNVGRKRNR